MTGLKFIIATSVLAYFVASCSNPIEKEIKKIKRKEIVFEGDYKTNKMGEIIFDGRDYESKGKMVFLSFPSIQEVPKILESSQLTTMTDGFGNKTITRNFYNDSLINFVILRESVKGQKKIFVYGHNGEVKLLSPDLAEKILKLPSEEIAKLAGISEGRKTEIATIEKTESQNLENLPSDNLLFSPTLTENSQVINTNQAQINLQPVESPKPTPIIKEIIEQKTSNRIEVENPARAEKSKDTNTKVEIPQKMITDLGTMRKPQN